MQKFEIEGLFDFLNKGVSAFHSTAAAVEILEANGYENRPETAAWELVPGGKYYTTRNSDSPTWKIKELDGGKDAVFARAETEGYGGMIMPSWIDRPLSVAGRILVRTEEGVKSILVHPDRALACIPNVCIHFDHEVNKGKNYNPQVDLQPIFGAAGTTLREVLAEEAGVKGEDILDSDLVLCTREQAERVGLKGEYFMSGRIDDLECAYTTLWGFLQGEGKEDGRGDMWVMFDNEEVGSSSRQGAQGTLMANVLARVEEKLGVTREQSIRACTNSMLGRQRPRHPSHSPRKERPRPPRYAGRRRAAEIQCPPDLHHQRFHRFCFQRHLPEGGCPCSGGVQPRGRPRRLHAGKPAGSSDIGLAQLAMHSSMETASCIDAEYMAKAVAEFYNTPISQPKDGEWKLGL